MQKKKFNLGRFAGKGYYIALILCAVAIGVSGYLYYQSTSEENPSLENTNPSVNVMNPSGGTLPTKPSVPSQPTQPSQPEQQPTVPPATTLETMRPLSGEVLMDYAMDCLCYNPTTRDWRTHSGMDFAAPAGTPVAAAADGTVYTVYEDEAMGHTVVIRHANGYVTTYASLSSDVQVSAGDVVTIGTTIGYAGNSALLETALGDHVHFAVTCDGKNVDPEVFFEIA